MINLIEPKIELLYAPSQEEAYNILGIAAANCYQSSPNSSKKEDLIRKIIKNKHHSVLEHIQITFKVTCDRAVSHEWVRHRIGVAYSQESQRYCAYKKELDVIKPRWFDASSIEQKNEFTDTVMFAFETYKHLKGIKAEDARAVLPNATATRIVVSMNLRAILHFLELRLSERAHPDIRRLAKEMKRIVGEIYPVMFA